ncbi:protein translocase subunit SecF [Flavobacteriaceae bacterium]|nr:protein translocase subunit SecF [Flavobacteriaceae bacterium]
MKKYKIQGDPKQNLRKIDFIKFHRLSFIISVILITTSLVLLFFKGLNLGVDFSGGSVIELKVNENFKISNIRSSLKEVHSKISIQTFNDSMLSIKLPTEEIKKNQALLIEKIKSVINSQLNKNPEYLRTEFVGPQIGQELVTKGIIALIISMLFVMIYVWIRFDLNFGVGATLAILHDAIFMFGFYAATQIEFNLSSIAAILTIIGYSINDSVVIYDRIRENTLKSSHRPMAEIINISINSTLSRTMLTSGITLLSLLALIFFGGSILFGLSAAIFFGVIVGTYSSIYIAAPTLFYIKPTKLDKSKSDQKF